MRTQQKPQPFDMSYDARLRGYERDKKLLLALCAHLPGAEFERKLKALQSKWRV